MTCEDCEKAQTSVSDVAYVRVDLANVAIVGCRKHVKLLLQRYNKGLDTEFR